MLNMIMATVCSLQVLRHFRFINAYDTVVFKGRVACEVHSHEVLLTELLFQNVFSDYSPAEIAALLSSMVFQQVNPWALASYPDLLCYTSSSECCDCKHKKPVNEASEIPQTIIHV